jgi:hypothetical protein
VHVPELYRLAHPSHCRAWGERSVQRIGCGAHCIHDGVPRSVCADFCTALGRGEVRKVGASVPRCAAVRQLRNTMPRRELLILRSPL